MCDVGCEKQIQSPPAAQSVTSKLTVSIVHISCWPRIPLIFRSFFFIRDSSAALSEEQKPKTWQIQPPVHTFLPKSWAFTFSVKTMLCLTRPTQGLEP